MGNSVATAVCWRGYVAIFKLLCCSKNETSHNGVQGDRKDSVKYEYPTTAVQPDQVPAVTYETVSLHEEDASETATKTSTDIGNPVYSEVRMQNLRDDLQLEHNPAYKTTDQS